MEIASEPSDSSAPESAAEPSFEEFKNLPPEIRIKIWKLVDAETSQDVQVEVTRKDPEDPLTFKAVTPVPVLFHISKETRMEAKKHYVSCFQIDGDKGRKIYINPSTDTLFILLPKIKHGHDMDVFGPAFREHRPARRPRQCAPAPWIPWGKDTAVMAVTTRLYYGDAGRMLDENVIVIRKAEGHKDVSLRGEVVRCGYPIPNLQVNFGWKEVSKWDRMWNSMLQEVSELTDF